MTNYDFSAICEKLKIDRISEKMEAVYDPEKQSTKRQFFLRYKFVGELKTFGAFLAHIANDIDQAGGKVTRIIIGHSFALQPHRISSTEKGNWTCPSVEFGVEKKEEKET